ncbi:MAG: hypothetical protein HY243_17005 [Proteobacteria bacterium]|nr:hypothetical protein [Pseudomonadota bacterium]
MKNIACAVAALSLLVSACAPDVPSGDPVLESDVVKTEADAIRIGVNACDNTLGERTRNPADWGARLEKDHWVVFFKDIVSVHVAKNDGKTGDCLVVIEAD